MSSNATRRSPSPSCVGLLALALATAAGLLAAAGAAAQSARPSFDHEGLARQVLTQHIRPLYADFAAKADGLRRTVEVGCGRHDAGDADAIRTAYRDLLLAWSRTEHLRFGPVVDGNRFERVVYWPDRQKIGERQVAQILAKADTSVLAADELAKKSVAVQGLTALETVLYGKSGAALLSDAPEGRFACAYAGAIAANVATIAKEVVADWADGAAFPALWLNPGEHNPAYKASIGTTAELLKAFRGSIYNARDLKLLPALGLKRLAVRGQLAPKSRPPYELSGLGLAAMPSRARLGRARRSSCWMTTPTPRRTSPSPRFAATPDRPAALRRRARCSCTSGPSRAPATRSSAPVSPTASSSGCASR